MQHAFDKFSGHAREAMASAQEEAQKHKHSYMGTEHLLLGLIDVEDCAAASILRELEDRKSVV